VRTLFPRALHVKAAELDRDWGTDSLRRGLLGVSNADEILSQWKERLESFKRLRERYLLYA
jgi:hypothetical protein